MDLTLCSSLVVFGGSFDPPHVAHVRLPQLARRKVRADVVVYVPAARSPLKTDASSTPACHRLAMLRLALADEPHAAILTDELDRAESQPQRPSYTVETLAALRERIGDEPTVHLLLGADQAARLYEWRQPDRILQLASPLVMLRPPWTRHGLLQALPALLDRDRWEQAIVELPPMDVSATEVRRRLAAGQSVEGMLDPAVARYVADHHLYQHHT
jgi:nicotinate-nucleotide adenylyltransferase